MKDELRQRWQALSKRVVVEKVEGIDQYAEEVGEVYVRRMPTGDREEYLGLRVKFDPRGNRSYVWHGAVTDLVRLCACDAEGTLLFGDDDRDLIAELPGDLTDKIYAAAAAINNLNEDTETGDAMQNGLSKELLKNSDAGRASVS